MTTTKSNTKTITVPYLARVEGEGAMHVSVRNGKVVDARLEIFEPPRFFEAFMRGRSFLEAPDITARICGICPVAYQMSAVHAMEDALGIEVTGPLRELRRLLYCGEWIESHVLHVFMLHAPDFLGYEDAIQMAADHPEKVQQALRIKKYGNDIVRTLAGREIHPINVRVGGFHRAPTKKQLAPLIDPLRWSLDATRAMIDWLATLPIPDLERDYEFVALRHPDEYPYNEGRIVSSAGMDIPVREWDDTFEESHVEHSNALHASIRERGAYMVGPLARYALNFDRLTPLARDAAKAAGLGPVCRNPFASILVRTVETLYAIEEALRILESYERPDRSYVETTPRAGTGYGASEAPRGLLYHRYRLDDEGRIEDALIVPPTSQNQQTIEDDLRAFVEKNLDMPTDELTWQCEQSIRNYDPCISCAMHFLKLNIERRDA